MVNIKNLNPNKIEIDEKSYKNTFIYHVGYMMVEDLSYATMNSVSPLHLIVNKINGYIERE